MSTGVYSDLCPHALKEASKWQQTTVRSRRVVLSDVAVLAVGRKSFAKGTSESERRCRHGVIIPICRTYVHRQVGEGSAVVQAPATFISAAEPPAESQQTTV